jgi:hypothetical protein
MATLTIISWRDIPAQVVCKRGRETAKVQLSARFQEAVDRAAMRAGKGSSDAYLADWKRSEPQPCGDDIQAVVAATAAEIEARYTDEELERLIKAKGLQAPVTAASGGSAGASSALAGVGGPGGGSASASNGPAGADGPSGPACPEGPAGPADPTGA